MDNRLGDIEIFLMAARMGSFAAAASALRLTPSAVSRSISRLEARLGVVLFRRTTRSLALTAEGEIYRDRMSELVADFAAVEAGLSGMVEALHGTLRVNASVPFGTQILLPLLPQFTARYPNLMINLALSDAIVDLVEERADIAIRIGPLRDTRLRAKKLGRSRMALVASPAYLEKQGAPVHPDDLDAHACLQFSFRRSVDSWPFRIGRRTIHRPVNANFLGNSGEVVRLMAVAGGGIARLGHFHVANDIRDRRLVEVLAAYNPGDGEDIHAVYSDQDRQAPRVRAFLDFLGKALPLPM